MRPNIHIEDMADLYNQNPGMGLMSRLTVISLMLAYENFTVTEWRNLSEIS